MVNCINERRVGSVTVLDLGGEIRTGGSRVALHDAIAGLLEEGRNQILLNLAGLSSIDASGLGELITIHVALHENGGRLKLLHLTRALREMMTMTKLLTVFDVYENEAEALACFSVRAVDLEGRLPSVEDTRSKRTLEVGVCEPGDGASEVAALRV